nr:uncharacterized protein LOC129380321 [Dermacentor andersoni]
MHSYFPICLVPSMATPSYSPLHLFPSPLALSHVASSLYPFSHIAISSSLALGPSHFLHTRLTSSNNPAAQVTSCTSPVLQPILWRGTVAEPVIARDDPDTPESSPQTFSASMMAAIDLDVLCGVLMQTPMKILLSLKDAYLWWLPDLKEDRQMQAIHSIRRFIEGFQENDIRTNYVATLYCCLAERQALRKWRSYRLTGLVAAIATHQSGTPLHKLLAVGFQLIGCHTKCTIIEREGIIYSCVMAASPLSTSLENDVICMHADHSRELVIVRVITRCEERVITALHQMLQTYTDLGLHYHIEKLSFDFASDRDSLVRVGALLRSNERRAGPS